MMPKNRAVVSEQALIRSVVKGVLAHEQEHKLFNVQVASADLATAGLVQGLTQHIVAGDTFVTRDGNTIVLKNVDVTWNPSVAAQSATVRLVLFFDSMNQGATPAVTDVLSAATPTSGYNVTNLLNNRFSFLLDEQIGMVGTSATGKLLRRHKFKLNRKILYNGTTFAASANGKGSLWALTVTDTASAGNIVSVLDVALRFTDS